MSPVAELVLRCSSELTRSKKSLDEGRVKYSLLSLLPKYLLFNNLRRNGFLISKPILFDFWSTKNFLKLLYASSGSILLSLRDPS